MRQLLAPLSIAAIAVAFATGCDGSQIFIDRIPSTPAIAGLYETRDSTCLGCASDTVHTVVNVTDASDRKSVHGTLTEPDGVVYVFNAAVRRSGNGSTAWAGAATSSSASPAEIELAYVPTGTQVYSLKLRLSRGGSVLVSAPLYHSLDTR